MIMQSRHRPRGMIIMRIFGRERQSLRIKKIKATRAVYVDGPGTEEINISFITEDGEQLDLQMPFLLTPDLISDLTIAYEAIVPPVGRRRTGPADWYGSSE